MPQAVSFRKRRYLSLTLTALALSGVAALDWIQDSRLAHTSYWTGAILLGLVLALMLLGIRRRLPVLSLGTVGQWTQVHIYLGLLAVGVYVLHVPAIIAGGMLESTLAWLFLFASLSGFYGLYASRVYPRRLTAVAGQYRFDQMEWHRRQLAAAAAGVQRQAMAPASGEVLNRFYTDELIPYFSAGPAWAYCLFPAGRRRRQLLRGLRELDRYIDADGQRSAGQLAALVRRRDDLDYQYVLQLRLRLWLVVHCLISIVLVVAAIAHAFIAWRFTS